MRLPARVRSQTGAELVEFALVLPMLLLIFGGIIDFGLILQRQQVVTTAAREGARLAILNGYQPADVQNRAIQFVRVGLDDATANPAVTCNLESMTPAAGPPFQAARVQVSLDSSFLILGPLVSLVGGGGEAFGTITLSSTSTMRVETSTAACTAS